MADSTLSNLEPASLIKKTDKLYLAQDDGSKSISLANVFANIKDCTLKSNIQLDSNVQSLSSSGIIDINKVITELSISSSSEEIIIPTGKEKQLKIIVSVSDGGGQFSVYGNIVNNSNIIFNDKGDSATLLCVNNTWIMIGGTATLS